MDNCGMRPLLKSVVKAGFPEEVMFLLRHKWRGRGRNILDVFRDQPEKPARLKWRDSEHGRWGQRGEQGCILGSHIQGRAASRALHGGSGMQVAMAAFGQERWQYVGIAGSQFNSYASILPPLQFQVTGATPRLFGVLLFQSLPFHLREAKHTC